MAKGRSRASDVGNGQDVVGFSPRTISPRQIPADIPLARDNLDIPQMMQPEHVDIPRGVCRLPSIKRCGRYATQVGGANRGPASGQTPIYRLTPFPRALGKRWPSTVKNSPLALRLQAEAYLCQ